MQSPYQATLLSHWGINASLSPLDGEFDLNFRAESDTGKPYLVKVMRAVCDPEFLDMQCKALSYIKGSGVRVSVSQVVQSLSGEDVITVIDESGDERYMWVLDFIEGTLYSQFKPKSEALIRVLGEQLGYLHKALAGFEHLHLHRPFNWNLMQAEDIAQHVDLFSDSGRAKLLKAVLDEYRVVKPLLERMPSVAVHNDVNDNNIVVSHQFGTQPEIAGFIDFGDLCAAPRVCDLAIASAYVVLDHPQPGKSLAALVSGFHQVQPLTEQEVDLVVPLLRLRLAVSVVTSTLLSAARPDDPYLVVSQAPAWRFLEAAQNTALLTARMRVACGFPVVTSGERVRCYLAERRGSFHPMLGVSLDTVPVVSLAVAQCSVPQDPFNLTAAESASLGCFGDIGKVSNAISTSGTGDTDDTNSATSESSLADHFALGCYSEPRLIYTDSSFRNGNFKTSPRRTMHLGVDVFAPAGTEIHAALPGTIKALENRSSHLDYGGLVVLEHRTDAGDSFFSLYGHLDPEVCNRLRLGQMINEGECFASLGNQQTNGGWSPHLHLQLALTLESMGCNWPGVADPDEHSLWTALCPNPAALLNLTDEHCAYQPIDQEAIRDARQKHFAPNLALSYREPLLFMRGWRHYLFDQWGRAYLDAYNNVPHIGHAHPAIQAVVAKQLSRLNTNTRYLHPAQIEFAEAILKTMPEALSVCYFVNSGSEANELALRLARAATGGKDIITPDHGYHGNTTGAIDISAYKFNAPGGVGQPEWVQLVDIPDDYRGRFRRGECDTAESYANQVDDALDAINTRGGRLAGFIAETFPSVGGQIIPPDGYLSRVYKKIRAAGGVCIADEVQTGLGRLGSFFYGIEQQQVSPDIIVLGKPIGNGHPLGVVVATREIAECFARGPEFFSTFGGSTLSCVIGKTVLDTVSREGLQQNAYQMGERLLKGLRSLQVEHQCIGDVRGMGLFIGVELVSDLQMKTPATQLASHVVNRLREQRILAGLEGPDNNVLKIRPPLTIEADDIDMIVQTLGGILSESASLG